MMMDTGTMMGENSRPMIAYMMVSGMVASVSVSFYRALAMIAGLSNDTVGGHGSSTTPSHYVKKKKKKTTPVFTGVH
ncbi:hypothetical protein [Bosea sp. (in: a-proteobacteria)]|uniref:hypothetical protein n=1 Tax=Bosea sp. (in: a-proteobacteria) TaxID=1871050 RepID=UPI0040334A44